MVSANVLYMIWEQIVFQERRIFLFTPTREEQVWVGGSEGGPTGTELPWALSRTRWAMPPSPEHLVQGAHGTPTSRTNTQLSGATLHPARVFQPKQEAGNG